MADAKAKPKKTSDLVVRIVLIVVLVIVAIMAIGNYRLRREYSKALDLYDQAKYQEAHDILEPLVKKPLAIIKIRGQARKTLGQCKLQLAVDIGQSASSKEGWTQALTMLEEARKFAGPTEEIETRIKEYREYIEKAEEPVKPAAAPAAAPPAE